jgi:hypothetical protein
LARANVLFCSAIRASRRPTSAALQYAYTAVIAEGYTSDLGLICKKGKRIGALEASDAETRDHPIVSRGRSSNGS